MKNPILLALCFTLLFACKEDEEVPRNIVYIGSTGFNPSVVTIPAGGMVIWENDDSVAHTVTSDSAFFDSGNLDPDETFSQLFPDAGTYSYHCHHHPAMTGTVVVQ